MLFNSLHFVVFFVLVTAIYFILPHRYRWQWLLVASCYFYMVFLPIYILILGFTIVIDYFAGIWIEKATDKKRRLYLILSLVANIGVLAIFKYYNFLNDNLSMFLQSIGYENSVPRLSILLPVGLSFHTFQAMSYTIEVYRGNQVAERHFGLYALYVMFYPQLVAGPIERPQNVLHQFKEKHHFNYQNVTNGLKLMAWGFFKKLVIADRLAIVVNFVYDNPTDFKGLPLLFATVCFAFQIYCDFSAYSDIAIGSARVMGFRLMRNFDRPYLSKSVAEFWQRWHISLSTWFRDYVYISLGGNRVGKWRWYRNLFLTFLLSGLWHGANWTYVIWGGLNGLYLVIETLIPPIFRLPKIVKGLLTFSLICLTWVFFRARTVSEAFYILQNMLVTSTPFSVFWGLDISKFQWLVFAFCMAVMAWVEWKQRTMPLMTWLNTRPLWHRWGLYLGLVLMTLLFGVFEARTQFIYFQF